MTYRARQVGVEDIALQPLSPVYTNRIFAAAAKRGDFHSAMISDLSHSSARIAGESRILSPAGQRHGFSGKCESRIESYFRVFRSRFFVLIQWEGPISPTWAQSKDVKVSTFPGVKLVKSTEVSGVLPLSSTWRYGWRNRKTYWGGGEIPAPPLYCKEGDYKDQVKRKNSWNQISNTLNIEGWNGGKLTS